MQTTETPAYKAYADYVGNDYASEDDFNDTFQGDYSTEKAFAEDWHKQTGSEIPNWLECHIDWESVAKDMFIDTFYSIDNPYGGVFVFIRN